MLRSAVIVAIVALLLAPALATAQAPEPVGTVSPDETSVARAYNNPSAFVNGTIGVFAFGFIAETESEASGMVDTLPRIFAAGMTGQLEGDDFVFQDPEEVPAAAIGDETTATRMAFVMFDTIDGEVVLLAVRQGVWVQILVGMGAGEVAVQPELEGLARLVQPRWPSEDPVAVREDGLRTGGIWNMMPVPEDMPEGFELDEELEEGPGATSDVVATAPPVSAPSTPAATPSVRDVPVLPTPAGGETPAPVVTEPPDPPIPVATEPPLPPTPTGAETPAPDPTDAPPIEPIEETPSPAATETPAVAVTPAATVTEVPASPVATVVPSERLALPFAVTVEIFLPIELATVSPEDGSCSGAGLLNGLTAGGTLTLIGAGQVEGSAETTLSGPGVVALDTETEREVCYFSAVFTEVPPRASYTLTADLAVLGRFTYGDLTSGERVVVEVEND